MRLVAACKLVLSWRNIASLELCPSDSVEWLGVDAHTKLEMVSFLLMRGKLCCTKILPMEERSSISVGGDGHSSENIVRHIG